MTSILVVCTGNICRSPIAEGFLRAELARRFGDAAPQVSSAGTSGWEGSGATAEGVQVARELGIDISGHVARRLRSEMSRDADLIICMAAEHRARLIGRVPEISGRAFTLKELVRLLEPQPPAPDDVAPWMLAPRVARAQAMRQSDPQSHPDEDIADPLGQPMDAYRAIAWELDEWVGRLATGLYGPAPSGTATTGPSRAAGA